MQGAKPSLPRMKLLSLTWQFHSVMAADYLRLKGDIAYMDLDSVLLRSCRNHTALSPRQELELGLSTGWESET